MPSTEQSRPEWFHLLKKAVLGLFFIIGSMHLTIVGYLLYEVFLGRFSVFDCDFKIRLIVMALLYLAFWSANLALQCRHIYREELIGCLLVMVLDLVTAYYVIKAADSMAPVVHWYYISIWDLLFNLLVIGVQLYCLALAWLHCNAVSSTAAAAAAPPRVIVVTVRVEVVLLGLLFMVLFPLGLDLLTGPMRTKIASLQLAAPLTGPSE